jgi:RNA polymerase sigma factor (sigma-70 family)
VVPDDLWAHKSDLVAYARRQLPCHEDAIDAVSETYLTAVQQWDSMDVVNVRAFLFGLLRHDLGNAIARRRRREGLGHLVPSSPLPASPEAEALGAITVAACLAFLPVALRDVMQLVYMDGFSRVDACAKLGISRGVLNYRLSTARRLLRDCLRKDDL